MSIYESSLRACAACALALAVSCQAMPTMESIKYGWTPVKGPTDLAIQAEPATADDYNDAAAGWAQAPTGEEAAPLYGRDGTPVGASAPGSIVETQRPMNAGVAPDGGSRSTLLTLYQDAVEEREALRVQNEDLSLALEMSEMRATDMMEQLKLLQIAYDTLGSDKQLVDQQSFDLAARLATAQIARLEAERALLEATLEWRRMSAANNEPLTADSGASSQPMVRRQPPMGSGGR